jgi:alkylhydroperoxidase/carboxymuconolactone decarboxylase family protein YurZ
VFCLRDVYLDGKHMSRSCLDLVAIAIDVSTGSDVQDQLRDSPPNHAGMLVQCHQHIGTGSIMLMGYQTSTG